MTLPDDWIPRIHNATDISSVRKIFEEASERQLDENDRIELCYHIYWRAEKVPVPDIAEFLGVQTSLVFELMQPGPFVECKGCGKQSASRCKSRSQVIKAKYCDECRGERNQMARERQRAESQRTMEKRKHEAIETADYLQIPMKDFIDLLPRLYGACESKGEVLVVLQAISSYMCNVVQRIHYPLLDSSFFDPVGEASRSAAEKRLSEIPDSTDPGFAHGMHRFLGSYGSYPKTDDRKES